MADNEAMEIMERVQHNTIVAMQAAWIEWKHGRGAEAAMQWIENTLDGPGLIPWEGAEEQTWSTDPNEYFSVNRIGP